MDPLRKYKKSVAHLIKFMIVGAVNFGVDYGVLTLLNVVLGVPVAVANTVSYTCGLVNSFFLNRYWTFKIDISFFSVYTLKPGRMLKKGLRIRFLSAAFLKFIFVNLVSLGVNTLTVFILVDMYGLTLFHNLAAKLTATVFSFVVNFAGSKLLVFREDAQRREGDGEA